MVFVVQKDPRNYSSTNFIEKWLLTRCACTTFAHRNCLHAKIDRIQCTLLRLLVYHSLGSLLSFRNVAAYVSSPIVFKLLQHQRITAKRTTFHLLDLTGSLLTD